MRNIFLTFLFLNVLISCGHKLNSEVENAVNVIANKKNTNSDSFWIRTDSSYKIFTSVSTINDLVYLTNDENPRVRYYAFLGLVDKNFPKIKEIYFEHQNDTEIISTTNGACLTNDYKVNELMLRELNPKDSEFKYQFTEIEYNKEYKKINKK